MSFFQLDPASLAARARADGPPRIPSLGQSLLIGIVGFTGVSVAGFIPWAAFGHVLGPLLGESGVYVVCALVFIALSGPALHRLIIGPGSLSRFYKVFSIAFILYAASWIVIWMSLRGQRGSKWGLFAGTLAMGVTFALAFHSMRRIVAVVAALFLLNAAGYFLGGMCDEALYPYSGLGSRLSWGVCYGIGFGAGLGVAFFLCQAEARRLLGRE